MRVLERDNRNGRCALPQWGLCVSDASLNLEMVVVLLVQIANAARLKAALTHL